MCLHPKIIRNKRYLPNKSNNFNPPQCDDERKLYVSIGCGVCSECASKKANDWKIRLLEEYNYDSDCIFVNLTISDEKIDEIIGHTMDAEANTVAKWAIRHFLEKVRKQTGRSVKHFFITELGQSNTERVHIHGFIWGIKKYNEIRYNGVTKYTHNLLLHNKWDYGHLYIGNFVNAKTFSYITKYITKPDDLHPDFIPKIFCSKGIGSNYLNKYDSNKHVIQDDIKKKQMNVINSKMDTFLLFLCITVTNYGQTMNENFYGLKNLMNKFDT